MSPTSRPEIVCEVRCELGEAPVVDESEGRLLWVDIPNGTLWQLPLGGRDEASVLARIGMELGAVALRTQGGWAAAARDGFGLIGEDGSFEIVAPATTEPWHRMNDAACDQYGRMWGGSTAWDFHPGGGCLHRWSGGPSATPVRPGMTLPNGMGWSPDGRQFYLIDSLARALLQAEVNDAGDPHDFRTLVAFAADEVADGLCVDSDGCLWVAMWGSGQVRQFSPSGSYLGGVELPVSKTTACTMSADGVMYVTSASQGIEPAQEAHAGKVFAFSTSAQGLPAHPFSG